MVVPFCGSYVESYKGTTLEPMGRVYIGSGLFMGIESTWIGFGASETPKPRKASPNLPEAF